MPEGRGITAMDGKPRKAVRGQSAQNKNPKGLEQFLYKLLFFLLINVHSKPVAQNGQHSRGRRVLRGCAANTTTLGARGQAPTR